MSDARLESFLDLDIAQALRQVDRLNTDVTRATTDVPVTADTRAVTSAIDAAILNARATVQITAEAQDITGEIDAALQAADTAVAVTADASEVTGSVTAAVDAADTNVQVTGEVDGSLRAGVQGLEDDLGEATAQAGLLRASIAGLSTAAVLGGIYAAATAASDLAESSSKASVVFGDSFGEIAQFAEGAATSVGLSNQAALEATGTFGNLFQALGATRDVAADLSPQVVTLAADLASFNNLGVEETLERLRSGLVGEVEPLRALGVSFLAADVERKVFELGLASANGEISEGAKLQARFALIMEQTSLAQGDFARTSEGLANQQRILRAEVDNAVASVGVGLLPTLLELVGVARDQVIPNLSDLGHDVLPAVVSILGDLAPVLGTTTQLLTLAGPPLQALAVLVNAIPAPLIAGAGALLLFNRAARLDLVTRGIANVTTLVTAIRSIAATRGVSTGTAALGVLGSSAQGALTTFARYLPVVGPAIAVVGGLADASARAAERQRLLEETTRGLTEALKDEEGVVRVTTDGLEEYLLGLLETGNEADKFLVRNLQASGSLDEFAVALREGGGELDRFVGLLSSAADAQGADILAGITDRLRAGLEEMAVAQIAAAESTGAITAAQAEQAIASSDVVAAYEDLRGQIDQHNAAMDAAEAKYGPLISQANALGDAYAALSSENFELTSQLLGVVQAGNITDRSLTQLAFSLDAAALSEDQMAAAAALLGTDVATLGAIIADVKAELDGFVSTALGGLPTVGDAFKPAEKGARSTGGAVRDVAKDTREMERAIRDAERGITEAQRGITDATEGVTEAYEDQADAVADVIDAQKDLADAEEALRKAREGPSARSIREGEIGIEQARIDAERAALRISDAEVALQEARAEGDPDEIRRAELDLQTARLAAEESVFGIEDAELALQEARAKGTAQDADVVSAEQAVRDAYDQVADAQERVVEATENITDAQLGVEEAAYRLVQAQEALADAHNRTTTAAGGSSGAIEAERVTLQQFVTNLRTQAAAIRQFLADIDAIAAAGGEDIARVLAEQGLEAGAGYARELVTQIEAGNTEMLEKVEAAVDDHNAAIAEAEDYLRNEFGPRYITTAGLVASLASSALGEDLTFAEKTRIAAGLAQTTLTEEGRALALIAATEGREAAEAYADLFDIDQPTLDSALAAAETLRNDDADLTGAAEDTGRTGASLFQRAFGAIVSDTEATVGDAAGAIAGAALANRGQAEAGGRELGAALGEGIEEGIRDFIGRIQDRAFDIMRAAINAAKGAAEVRSPSAVWRRLGHDLVDGLVAGLDDQTMAAADAAAAVVPVPDLPASVGSIPLRRVQPVDTAIGGSFREGDTIVHVTTPTVPGMTPDQAARIGTAQGDAIAQVIRRQKIGTAMRIQGIPVGVG